MRFYNIFVFHIDCSFCKSVKISELEHLCLGYNNRTVTIVLLIAKHIRLSSKLLRSTSQNFPFKACASCAFVDNGLHRLIITGNESLKLFEQEKWLLKLTS